MPINVRDLQSLVEQSEIANMAAANAELQASLRQFADVALRTSDIAELVAQMSQAAQIAAQLSEIQEQLLDAIAPTIAFQQQLSRLVEPSAKQFAEIFQSMHPIVPETTRLDEALAVMSHLAAPTVERLVEAQLAEWHEARIWEPTWEVPTEDPRDERQLSSAPDSLSTLHERLTRTIVSKTKLAAESETQLASLLALIALATGSWVMALFFTLDLLRQFELARRPSSLKLRESDRDWAVILEWDEEGEGWVTFVPELNNISTFGSTREEVLARTHEAIRGYIHAASKRGMPIPEQQTQPRSLRRDRLTPAQSTSA